MRKLVVDGVVAHWLGAYAVLEHTPMGEERHGGRRLRTWKRGRDSRRARRSNIIKLN